MKNNILKYLNENNFISGEVLAEKLNVSRTMIWKNIKNLQNLGYDIESVKNKGYLIISRPDIPIFEEVYRNIDTEIIGKNIHYFKTIGSTNNYCKKLMKEGVSEGTIVVSDIQTQGRGRKDRFWYSPSGGLWFSTILYPEIPPQNGMLVTMTVSTSIAQAIKETTGLEPIIKWPNDLLIKGRKVCGVLTELDAEMDKINYSIVGTGINVNNKIDGEIEDIATSLKIETGSKVSRVDLLRNIIVFFDENYKFLKSGNYGFIRELWNSFSNIVGRKIKVVDEKKTYEGVVSDIDDSGCLILDTDSGTVRVVTGDITYL